MDFDSLTIGQVKELMAFVRNESKSHSFEIGKSYFVRTVTYHYLGRLVSVTDSDLVFADASWVASSGRFHKALAEGVPILDEVEPYPANVIVSRAVIVDASVWDHDLPGEAK